jgi:hypothetical protein
MMADLLGMTPPPVVQTPKAAGGGGGGPRSSETGKVATPELQQANRESDTADEAEQTALREQNAQNIGAADDATASAGIEANVRAPQEKEAGDIHAEIGKRFKDALNAWDEARKLRDSAHYENHWDSQPMGVKIRAAVSSFLAGLGGHSVNRAQEWIDADHQMQEDKIKRIFEVAKSRGEDVQHLQDIEAAAHRNNDASYESKMKAVVAEAKYEAAKRGTQQARANAAVFDAQAQQKIAEKHQKAAAELVPTIVNSVHAARGLPPPQYSTKIINGKPVMMYLNRMDGKFYPVGGP